MKTFKEFNQNQIDEGLLDSIKDIGGRILSATGRGIVKVAKGTGKAIGAFGGGLVSGFRGAVTGGGGGGGGSGGGNYRSEIEELKRKYEALKSKQKTSKSTQQDTQSGKDQKDQGTQSGKDQKDQGTQSGKDQQDQGTQSGKDQQDQGTQSGKDQQDQGTQSGKDQKDQGTQSGKDQQDQGTQSGKDQQDQGTQSGKDQQDASQIVDGESSEKEKIMSAREANKTAAQDRQQQMRGSGKSTQQKKLEKDKTDAARTSIQYDANTGKRIAITDRLGKKQSQLNADKQAITTAKKRLGDRIAKVTTKSGSVRKETPVSTLQYINRDLSRTKGAEIRRGMSSSPSERQKLIAAKAEAARRKVGAARAQAGGLMGAYESRDMLKSILKFIG
jgi:hypothetical protein